MVKIWPVAKVAARVSGLPCHVSKPQGEKFLRVPVHEDPRCVVFYFDQIGREPVSAVDIIDQVRELITRDCLLVMFENIPPRLVPKDANVLRGLETCCKDRRE